MDGVTLTAVQTGIPSLDAALARLDQLLLVLAALAAIWQRVQAARSKGALEAVVAGVEEAARRLPPALAKQTKGAIRAVTEARGVEPVVRATVEHVTRERRTVDEHGDADPLPRNTPPPPPRLGLLLVLVLPLLTGCVASAARDLAVRHEQLLHKFDGASVPHPSYTVDDAEPGKDGRKMTAEEKMTEWRSAREELLRSAAELRRVLGEP